MGPGSDEMAVPSAGGLFRRPEG
ncbi:hypothetical protein RB2501_10667 [Robiginitalea biformata HTCC2501]|uniref:Uncharacterized protein n=1 Tax=Robiginitalea biformata (strain ATCC BAA-864 / DSM 15991 / KCTC 12146 / HTCC2501) TaxID=313596 RepID=A4CM90_ROBBH|nr:hypothetical protein RB2501_10667 [Robiginitalea biformata HTCC2501]